MEEGDGLRTRSFRYEDYETRRVFLRSYPLQFDNNEDGDQETQARATTHDERVNKGPSGTDTREFDHCDQRKKEKKIMKMKKKKEAMKKIMLTIVEWGGGRIVVLRRFKQNVSFYVVACFPISFKPPKALTLSR